MTLRIVFIAALAILAACAQRGEIRFAERADTASLQTIHVATNRMPDRTVGFGDERSRETRFVEFDISIPPNRTAGEINWSNGKVDTSKDFATVRANLFNGQDSFERSLRARLLKRPPSERHVVVYVHGFNNNFSEGLYRAAQIAEDFTFTGEMAHFSWPSAGSAFGYAYDRDSVLAARNNFENFIDAIDRAGASEILIIGHSVGSSLVMETLRSIALGNQNKLGELVSGVLLISPDIDIDVFFEQASRIEKLPQPFGIVVSDRDRALRVSALITGQPNRLGNIEGVHEIAEFEVTVFNLSNIPDSDRLGHFTAATSPMAIEMLNNMSVLNEALQSEPSTSTGIVPGVAFTLQRTTEIILDPVQDVLK